MKRILSAILLIFTIVLLPKEAFAAEKSEIFFDTYSGENEKICVDVRISEEGDPSMLQFCVAYDSELLECVLTSAGDAFLGNSAPTINQTDGKIYFIWDSFTPLESGGTMLHIEFLPKGEENTSVTIDKSESFVVADSSFEEIGIVNGEAKVILSESGDESGVSSDILVPENGSDNEIVIEKDESSSEILEQLENEITDGNDQKVIHESSDESVVKIENGEIIPVSPGTATITVKTEDGEKEVSQVITVVEDIEFFEEAEVLTNSSEKNSFGLIIIPVALIFALTGGAIYFKKKKTDSGNK